MNDRFEQTFRAFNSNDAKSHRPSGCAMTLASHRIAATVVLTTALGLAFLAVFTQWTPIVTSVQHVISH